AGYRGHDYHFTFAEKIGNSDCELPTFGIQWRATRHPVILDCWSNWPVHHEAAGSEPDSHSQSWTTVMSWNNFERPMEHDGRVYGAKEREFGRIEQIPQHSGASFEVAVSGDAPHKRWRDLGWKVVRGNDISASVDDYRAYICSSHGEFSVAKNVYVE